MPESEWQETALKFRPLLDALAPRNDSTGAGK
jgi:isochorismate synthase EntC